MLPKHSRLTKETIEKHLIKARRMQTSRFLVMHAIVQGLNGPQVSLAASKKVAPKAVLRNRLRRRGYAAVRPLIPRISPESAILISYTKPDAKVSIPEMTAEIAGALEKTSCWKGAEKKR